MGSSSHASADGLVVVALGGNTLLGAHGPWTSEAQRAVIERTARSVAVVVEAGYDVVLTHGNGPQVGTLLLQQENAPDTPQFPLDVVVAETQGQIGYLLQQALANELRGRDVVTVVTQVVVDGADPAFGNPTKPIGPFYTDTEARTKPFETRAVSVGDRPYRRVVPSPEPVEIVETGEIARLVTQGALVVCVGGGGVPVVRTSDGRFRGVEAVVDKDLATRVLASELGAHSLVVLTDVDSAYVNFGESNQRPLSDVRPDELRAHLRDGQFGTGSMRPKVEACLQFVEAGGALAVIASPDDVEGALRGRAGTRVRP